MIDPAGSLPGPRGRSYVGSRPDSVNAPRRSDRAHAARGKANGGPNGPPWIDASRASRAQARGAQLRALRSLGQRLQVVDVGHHALGQDVDRLALRLERDLGELAGVGDGLL